MLSIGEFASLTGLSVKALRHYDQVGVLTPAEVEPNGYRQYGEAQVRAGVIAKALRAAGVPLPAVAAALHGGDSATVLADYQRRVLAARDAQDVMFVTAGEALSSLALPVEVFERDMPAQEYLTCELVLGIDEDTAVADQSVAERFDAMLSGLLEVDTQLAGQPWLTFSNASDPQNAVVWCCLPVVEQPENLPPRTFRGKLPPSRELVAIWDRADPAPTSLHPTVVALCQAITDRGLKRRPKSQIRQILGATSDGRPAVEVAIAVVSLDGPS